MVSCYACWFLGRDGVAPIVWVWRGEFDSMLCISGWTRLNLGEQMGRLDCEEANGSTRLDFGEQMGRLDSILRENGST